MFRYYAFVECSQLCLRYGHEIDLVKARLCCLSRFSLQDMGTIIIGKIESGVIAKGDMVTVMPNRVSLLPLLWLDLERNMRVVE